METITINDINVRPLPSTLVIVKYLRCHNEEGTVQLPIETRELEATMNTKWQAQEVDYIQKDVGKGGTVSVMIQQKGEYTNITKVDLTSAKKGEGTQMPYAPVCPENPQPKLNEPSRDDKWRNPAEMQAIELVKCATELAIQGGQYDDNEKLGEFLCMAVTELHGAYKVALDRLK